MFSNEVPFEARGFTPNGIEIIVTEKAFAESEISYEDAWLKAYALAKEKAEAKLAETLKKISEEVKDKLVLLKGERGYCGPRGGIGPAGPAGAKGSAGGSYQVISGRLPSDIGKLLLPFAIYSSTDSSPGSDVPLNVVKQFQTFSTQIMNYIDGDIEAAVSLDSENNPVIKLSDDNAAFISFVQNLIDHPDNFRKLLKAGLWRVKRQFSLSFKSSPNTKNAGTNHNTTPSIFNCTCTNSDCSTNDNDSCSYTCYDKNGDNPTTYTQCNACLGPDHTHTYGCGLSFCQDNGDGTTFSCDECSGNCISSRNTFVYTISLLPPPV